MSLVGRSEKAISPGMAPLCVLLFILGVMPTVSVAQGPVFDSLPFQRLTIKDGLPSHDLTVAVQDHMGFLWLGGMDGLTRFDGYTSVHYQHIPDDTTSMSHNGVVYLYADQTGNLWVGTPRGIDRFDRETETFTHVVIQDQLVWPGFSRILEDREGTIWAGTLDGLVALNRDDGMIVERFQHRSVDPQSLSHNDVRALYEDRNGMLWVGTAGGLNHLDRRSGHFTRYAFESVLLNVPDQDIIVEIKPASEDELWIGTTCALYRFNITSEQFRRIDVVGADTCLNTIALQVDGKNTLWLTTTRPAKLYRLDVGDTLLREQPIQTEGSVAALNAILEDRSGVLWLAARTGLYKMNPTVSAFSVLRPDLWDRYQASSLYQDSENNLWVGLRFDGILYLDRNGDTVSRYVHDPTDPTSLGPGIAGEIIQDEAGAVWVALYGGGLSRIDPNTNAVTTFRHDSNDPTSLSTDLVDDILIDRDGVLWVGTWEGGLNRFHEETGTFTRFQHDPSNPKSLPGMSVICLYEDRFGTLWLGLESGAARYDKATRAFQYYRTAITYDIIEDPAGRIWTATNTGIYLIDPETDQSRVFTAEDGLAHNVARALQVDRYGYLWIGTDNGLSRFDLNTKTFRNYSTTDGLASDVFGVDQAYAGADGTLYFISEGKVITIESGQLPATDTLPPVALTGFQISGEPVIVGPEASLQRPIALAERIVLLHDQNDVSFTFAALDYERPEANTYSYRLEGYDEDWSKPGAQRTATYTNLDPGDYVFRVRAANRNGAWNETGASVAVIIQAPWWRTWWAYTLFAGLFVAILLGIRRYELKRIHLRRQLSVEQEKTAMLREMDELKSRFFTNISHEFRTPLTLILGPLKDMARGLYGPVSSQFHRQLDLIIGNANRLNRLVDELLDLSKIESGAVALKIQQIDLADLCRTITLSFASRADRDQIALSFDAEPERIGLFADRAKLEKVLVNLLANAFNYTASHGKIRVSVRLVQEDIETLAEVSVRDTGEGIPKKALPYIFDRFYQSEQGSRRDSGTGIGLALAKELVELHRGTIQVESQPGFGSTFIFRLQTGTDHFAPEDLVESVETMDLQAALPETPYAPEPHPEPQQTASLVPDASILLVEDNRDVRFYLHSILSDRYHLLEAENGLDGLKLAIKEQPDLIISDVMMPEMDGFTLCRRLKDDDRTTDIPVILLTAKATVEAKLEGLDEGAIDYIYKPFDALELSKRVDTLIAFQQSLKARYSDELILIPTRTSVQSAQAVFLKTVGDVVATRMGDSAFGVEQLANEVGLTRQHLRRKLLKLTNLTPTVYIRMARIKQAEVLLKQKWGTIAEIAYEVGFKDPHYFSRLFKKVHGMPPTEWVKMEPDDGSTEP